MRLTSPRANFDLDILETIRRALPLAPVHAVVVVAFVFTAALVIHFEYYFNFQYRPVVDAVQIRMGAHVEPPARILIVGTVPNEGIIVAVLRGEGHFVVPRE